jgi:hypothetical protein
MPHHNYQTREVQRFALQTDRAAGAARCPLPTSGIWVSLHQWEDCLGSDLALLLCPESDGWWAVWIPDWGPAALHNSQFSIGLSDADDSSTW